MWILAVVIVHASAGEVKKSIKMMPTQTILSEKRIKCVQYWQSFQVKKIRRKISNETREVRATEFCSYTKYKWCDILSLYTLKNF